MEELKIIGLTYMKQDEVGRWYQEKMHLPKFLIKPMKWILNIFYKDSVHEWVVYK